jgi:hypothetical protein
VAYLDLTEAQAQVNAPLNETLFGQVRANFIALFTGTRIESGLVQTASIADLNVTNAKLAASAVSTAKLKTTTSTVSHSGAGAQLFPTNSGYAFSPRIYANATASGTGDIGWVIGQSSTTIGTSAALQITIKPTSGRTWYAEFRYVQSSPPHAFAGVEDWGLFVYLLRNKATGEVVSASVAEDPVWDGDHSPLPKGHPARIAERPHPFADYAPYTDRLPSDSGLEIVLVDMHEQSELVRCDTAAMRREFLAAERARHLALGVSAAELDAFEESQVAQLSGAAERMPAWQAAEATAMLTSGKTLPMLIHEGLYAPCLATKEIAARDKLPSCSRFRDIVTVVTS